MILAKDNEKGKEKKIVANNGDKKLLLKTILKEWEKESLIPLFVSEGTSEQKQESIQKSNYLNTVYGEVLVNLGSDNLIIYGFSFDDNDLHILKGIPKSQIKKVAVSVYGEGPKVQDFCNNARQVLTGHFDEKKDDKDFITFFDSKSEGCWIYQKDQKEICLNVVGDIKGA